MSSFLGLLTVAGIGVLVWVACDAARRQRNWFVWTLPVLFFGLIGLIPWLITRRRTPVAGTLRARQIVSLSVSVIALVAMRIITAIFVTTFLFQAARIEGHAMEPTLNDQDRLVVNKLAFQRRAPDRDDIVMLYYPNNPEKIFVKRVVATEGNEIRITAGTVFVNGLQRTDTFVPEKFRSHDDWGPEVVPEGYYFVMGDHRNNSSDSRHWRYVPKKYIIGRVQWRWWPVGSAKSF